MAHRAESNAPYEDFASTKASVDVTIDKSFSAIGLSTTAIDQYFITRVYCTRPQ
jgi:hypothetical protein